MLGNYFAADALYNIRIGIYGIKVSFRFIAKDNVPVNKVMYFNAYSLEKSGYHAGNGGKVRIELQTNNKDNNPSGEVLCYGLVEAPTASPKQLMVKFDRTAVLKKESVYHVVFSNYDDSPSDNYVSVNTMAKMTNSPINSPSSPELDSLDMTVLVKSDFADWTRFKNMQVIIPIFSLFFEIEDFGIDYPSVIGYTFIESWLREPRKIVGNYAVRQRFTAYKNDKIENVVVRIARNGNPANITATIYEGNKPLSYGDVPSVNIPVVDLNSQPGYRIGHDWVTIKLNNKVKLVKGREYFIVLQSELSDGSYEVFPLREGSEFGYPEIWPSSWCEYTLDWKNWVGWDAWGNSNLKNGCLQLYLK